MALVTLQSVAQTEETGLFSICFEGESFSEFQKFIIKHRHSYNKDLNLILYAIQKMMSGGGFLERRFRPEGKMRDRVCALPIESGNLRLYCLRMNDRVLIAGNGGVKDKQTYQECKDLNGYVVTLQKLDQAINVALKKGEIVIEENNIELDKPLEI